MHANSDFARITKHFPDSVLEEDGSPTFVLTIADAEDDPISLVIDHDGNVTFGLDGESQSTYAILTPDNIRDIGRAQRKVRALAAKWIESASGQAWADSQGL